MTLFVPIAGQAYEGLSEANAKSNLAQDLSKVLCMAHEMASEIHEELEAAVMKAEKPAAA
jgi:hypothetical protein